MLIDEDVRALCFWQPFGTLMLYDKIETRGYSTDYRGLVLICTTQKSLSKQNSPEGRRIMPLYADIVAAMTKELMVPEPTGDLNGYAIAIGRLVDCRKVRKDDNTYFMHWPELYAHVYQDVRRIKPFKFKGFQGRPRLISEEVKQQIIYL